MMERSVPFLFFYFFWLVGFVRRGVWQTATQMARGHVCELDTHMVIAISIDIIVILIMSVLETSVD